MTKQVFIQIGLNGKLEYSYLAEPEYKRFAAKHKESKFYCPEILLDKGPYSVIGVCMNPERNEIIRKGYAYNPNIYIWDYLLWHENLPAFTHGDYFAVPEYVQEGIPFTSKKYIGEAITLNKLIQKIQELPGYAECNIAAIHLNIEGSEKDVLESLERDGMSIRPLYFRIGVTHGKVKNTLNIENRENYITFLTKEGYRLIKDSRDDSEYISFIRDAG